MAECFLVQSLIDKNYKNLMENIKKNDLNILKYKKIIMFKQ